MTLLGERLAAQDPNDFAVVVGLESVLRQTVSTPEKHLALIYAQAFVRQRPNEPSSYSLLASIHYSIWEGSTFTNRQAGAEAIALYTKAISLMAKDDPFIARFNEIIAQIRRLPR